MLNINDKIPDFEILTDRGSFTPSNNLGKNIKNRDPVNKKAVTKIEIIIFFNIVLYFTNSFINHS